MKFLTLCAGLLLVLSQAYLAVADDQAALVPVVNYLLFHKAAIKYPPETSFTPIPTDTTLACPGYLHAKTGTVFGNKITRLSDYPAVQINFPYPKTPSFNSDGSLLMLATRLLDARTYQTIAEQAWWDNDEKKWSATQPHIYYAMEHNHDLDGDGINDHAFVRRDVTPVLNHTATIPDREELIVFSGKDYRPTDKGGYWFTMGHNEGNIDHQDRYVVFSARKKDANYLTAIVFDIQQGQVIAQKDMTNIAWVDGHGDQVFDWISVSPSGSYILINWIKDPNNPSSVFRGAIDQYDLHLNFIRELAHQGQHGDIGVQANGKDMYVQFEFGTRNGIWGYDLESGQETQLLPDKYNGGHVSCRNYGRPGWCYLSTTAEGYREVFALKLDDSGTVNRFAQTHQTTWNSEGGVNADGTKIIFLSDWHATTALDSHGNHVHETFIVEVEQN